MFVCASYHTPLSLASAFTWEVKANNRTYNDQFKEKAFLCWQRKKYKVGSPSLTALPYLLPLSLPLPPSFNHEQVTSLMLGFPVFPWPHPSSSYNQLIQTFKVQCVH